MTLKTIKLIYKAIDSKHNVSYSAIFRSNGVYNINETVDSAVSEANRYLDLNNTMLRDNKGWVMFSFILLSIYKYYDEVKI